MKITTKRLIIRPWSLLDVNDMYEYAKNPLVAGLTGFLASDSITNQLRILNTMILANESYAIVLKDDNTPIGSIGIMKRFCDSHIDPNLQREIGYSLNQKYWGHGYMPEVIYAIMEYCFDTLKIELLWVGHADYNANSKHVIEKMGFEYRFDCNIVFNNHFLYHYVMSKDLWNSTKNAIQARLNKSSK